MAAQEVVLDVSANATESTTTAENVQPGGSMSCCDTSTDLQSINKTLEGLGGKRMERISYAENKNMAEGLMDIALLSANANQLRFLITYNYESSTYYFSMVLILLSLILQVAVGIALIFKRRYKLQNNNSRSYMRCNEFLLGGVFMVTVVNILLTAFTTTNNNHNHNPNNDDIE